MKKVLLIIIIVISEINSRAADGCLVGTTVYTNFQGYSTVNLTPLSLGTKIFGNSASLSTITDTCPAWANVYSSSGSCIYGPATLGLNLGGYQIAICTGCSTGTLVQYDFINCPLDDYTWALSAVAGAFGILAIKRRKETL